MTFDEIFKKVKDMFKDTDASNVTEHLASRQTGILWQAARPFHKFLYKKRYKIISGYLLLVDGRRVSGVPLNYSMTGHASATSAHAAVHSIPMPQKK